MYKSNGLTKIDTLIVFIDPVFYQGEKNWAKTYTINNLITSINSIEEKYRVLWKCNY